MRVIRFVDRIAKPRSFPVGVELDAGAEKIKFELPEFSESQVAALYWETDERADVAILDHGVWAIDQTITQYEGEATCYISVSVDGEVMWHSAEFTATITSLSAIEDRLDVMYPTAIQQAATAAGTALQHRDAAEAAQDAAEAAQTAAETAQAAAEAAQAGAEQSLRDTQAAAAAAQTAIATARANAVTAVEDAGDDKIDQINALIIDAEEIAREAIGDAVSDAEAATGAATSAAGSATSAAAAANAAAGSATDAAAAATGAATAANTAAGAANTAAGNANTKATAADTAASAANTAAGSATSAATAANAAAAAANTAADNADEARENIEADLAKKADAIIENVSGSGSVMAQNAVGGAPVSLDIQVAATATEGSPTPDSPITITGATSASVALGPQTISQDMTALVGAQGVGIGVWQPLEGKLTESARLFVVTADDVTEVGTASGGQPYASITLPMRGSGTGAALVCSHYPIVTGAAALGIRCGNERVAFVYDARFTDIETAKSIIGAMGLRLEYILYTEAEYTAPVQTLTLDPGGNTLTVTGGVLMMRYAVDTRAYVDNADTALSARIDALAGKADVDGDYPDMTVGMADNADQLVSTVPVIDKVPYVFRTAGGANDIGNRETDMIVGGTIAWNQLVAADAESVTVPNGHKFIMRIPSPGTDGYWGVGEADGTPMTVSGANGDMVFDITQMFGTETVANSTSAGSTSTPRIADYIYDLEQASPGAGVAWFRRLFPADHYNYNAGELMSVKAVAHKTVGFNAYDPTAGAAKVLAGHEYQITGAYTALTLNGAAVSPDSDGYFTPDTTGLLTVAGGDAATTCVHLTWDGVRDGQFEPYEAHTYPLDDDLELCGVPMLDENNGLYYDGDIYESSGAVKRNYRVVDLGSLTWIRNGSATQWSASISSYRGEGYFGICSRIFSYDRARAYNSSGTEPCVAARGAYLWIHNPNWGDYTAAQVKAALSGVYLAYKLASGYETTETADPYDNPQTVDNFGTEGYVDARDIPIPVGHETAYMANLRAKLEMAPNSPDGDGDYVVRQTNGKNEYVPLTKELPAAPDTDGVYTLKLTVTDGEATLSWEAET